MFALACEKSGENLQRQKLLFLFALLSSITSGTVSAVQRLLRGPRKMDFVEDVEMWRGQLDKIIEVSPPWIGARIRPVLANLAIL